MGDTKKTRTSTLVTTKSCGVHHKKPCVTHVHARALPDNTRALSDSTHTTHLYSKTRKLLFSPPSIRSPGGTSNQVKGGENFNAAGLVSDAAGSGGGGAGGGSSSEDDGHQELATAWRERAAGGIADETQAVPRNVGVAVSRDTCSTPCAAEIHACGGTRMPLLRPGASWASELCGAAGKGSLVPMVAESPGAATTVCAAHKRAGGGEGRVGSRLSLRKMPSPAVSRV